MRRLGILTSLVMAGSFAVAAPVLAAAPTNDDIGSPTIVGSLPYTDGENDTTAATTGATDPGFCFEPGGSPDRSTVWYSFTPTLTDSYLADTLGSDYDTTLYVGTPNGSGGIDVIACVDDTIGVQSAVRWDALADTTYLLMVGTCCGGGVVGEAGGGGVLVFHVGVAPPPPTVDLVVNARGSFTSNGTATIRGTIACSGDVQSAEINLDLSQRTGRFIIRGFGGTAAEGCSTSPTPWSIDVLGDNGKFAGGAAQVNASAFACGVIECAEDSVSQTTRLRR